MARQAIEGLTVRGLSFFMGAALLLSGCGGGSDNPVDSDHALERAAAERGLIGVAMAEPAGIFERRLGNMRERLCVARSGDEGWRFAAELSAGTGASCLTGGVLLVSDALSDGDEPQSQSWKMRFRGLDGCEIEAVAQGDALLLPDHMPAACSKLCAGRASLVGAEMERTSWAEAEALALRLRGADGSIWTDCGQKKAN